jgi:hypothetical protein
MMIFAFRNLSNSIDQMEGFLKVRQLIGLAQMVFLNHFPISNLASEHSQSFTLERKHSPPARHTTFLGKIGHNEFLLRYNLFMTSYPPEDITGWEKSGSNVNKSKLWGTRGTLLLTPLIRAN